jgi:hypothetical protein
VLVSAAYNEAQDPGRSCSLDAIFAKLLEVVRHPVLAGLQGYYAEIDYFRKLPDDKKSCEYFSQSEQPWPMMACS